MLQKVDVTFTFCNLKICCTKSGNTRNKLSQFDQVKLWSSQLWTQFLQLRREVWKIQDFNGVWTRDLAIPVGRSNQLSYEATDVGSWSFVGSNGPVRNESMMNGIWNESYMNCRYEIKWSYDLRSYERNFCNCVEKPAFITAEIIASLDFISAVHIWFISYTIHHISTCNATLWRNKLREKCCAYYWAFSAKVVSTKLLRALQLVAFYTGDVWLPRKRMSTSTINLFIRTFRWWKRNLHHHSVSCGHDNTCTPRDHTSARCDNTWVILLPVRVFFGTCHRNHWEEDCVTRPKEKCIVFHQSQTNEIWSLALHL